MSDSGIREGHAARLRALEETTLPANKLANLKRRVDRAMRFPVNTCPASRHLHMIALALAAGQPYAMLDEDPEHCAGAMLSMLESLWKARTQLSLTLKGGK